MACIGKKIGFAFVSAKYIPQERGDSHLLLRYKRSDSDESVSSIDRESEDSDNDDLIEENKRLEEQIKLREKEEKLHQKQLQKLEKERRKNEERQRKVEEKLAKEARKLQERNEKEERKRQERLEKEKRKQEENERKIEEKVRREQLKEQEKELADLHKEVLEQSDEDDFLETEEESSVELEDIWRSHIYQKYGLTIASTKQEKQAAIDKYLQDELGLNPNSTVTERRQVIIKLIQSKLETDLALRESLRNQILSHVNAVALQKLQAKLENDIKELDNKTELLNNVSLPWATQAQQAIQDKKSLLETVVQFFSSLLPKWVTAEQTLNLSPDTNNDNTTNINTSDLSSSGSGQTVTAEQTLNMSPDTNNDNTINTNTSDLSSSGSGFTSKDKMSSSDDSTITKNSETTKNNALPYASNDNKLNTDKNTNLVDSGLVTETSSILQTSENSDTSATQIDNNKVISPIITKPETADSNSKVNTIESDNIIKQNNGGFETDNIASLDEIVSTDVVKTPDTNNDTDLLSTPIDISEKTLITNSDPGQNDGNWSQIDINTLNPNENKGADTTITENVKNNKKDFSELNTAATPSLDIDSANLKTESVASTQSDSLTNDWITATINNGSTNNSLESNIQYSTETAVSDSLPNNIDKNSSPNNYFEENGIRNITESAKSADINPPPINSKNSVDDLLITNNIESDKIRNTTEKAVSADNNFLPLGSEDSVNTPVVSNDIKNNVVNEENIALAENALPIATSADITENIITTESSFSQNEVGSSVVNTIINNDATEKDANLFNSIMTESSNAITDSNNIGNSLNESNDPITSISKIKNSSDNSSSAFKVTVPDNINSISNYPEESVINIDNGISTESSGIVIAYSTNTDVLATNIYTFSNTDVVTPAENIEVEVISTEGPIDLVTRGSEPTTKEVTILSTGEEILNINNLSTTSNDNTKSDSALEAITQSDIVYNNSVTDTIATITTTDLESGADTNKSVVIENLGTPGSEAIQPNTMPANLLTTNVYKTTEVTITDPSSTATTSVSENNVDSTIAAVTTEINSVDGITIPVEQGADVVDIISQTA